MWPDRLWSELPDHLGQVFDLLTALDQVTEQIVAAFEQVF